MCLRKVQIRVLIVDKINPEKSSFVRQRDVSTILWGKSIKNIEILLLTGSISIRFHPRSSEISRFQKELDEFISAIKSA